LSLTLGLVSCHVNRPMPCMNKIGRFLSTEAAPETEEYHTLIKNTERAKGMFMPSFLLLN